MFSFKCVNVFGKSTINDGVLVLSLLMIALIINFVKDSINYGGLVKTFEASFDKPTWRVVLMFPFVFLRSWVSFTLFKLNNLAM